MYKCSSGGALHGNGEFVVTRVAKRQRDSK